MNEARQIPLVRLFGAIKDAVNEMDRCPKDSVEDIWNEMLDKWETGLRMDRNYNIKPNNWNEMLDKWGTGLRMDRNYNIKPNAEVSGAGTASAGLTG